MGRGALARSLDRKTDSNEQRGVMLRLHFGKYKGKRLPEIPSDYLCWVLNNCTNLSSYIRQAIEEHLESLDDDDEPTFTAGAPPRQQQSGSVVTADLVRTWWRGLALDYHPDRGGDVRVMQALSDAHDRLRKMVGV